MQLITIRARSLAMSGDGKLLLVGTEGGIVSVDAQSDEICQRVSLEGAPLEMAFGTNGSVYALLPNRIFIDDRNALECH